MLILDDFVQVDTGVQQGSPLSPLLGNIMLQELDKELEQRGHPFVRYADDSVLQLQICTVSDVRFHSVPRFFIQFSEIATVLVYLLNKTCIQSFSGGGVTGCVITQRFLITLGKAFLRTTGCLFRKTVANFSRCNCSDFA